MYVLRGIFQTLGDFCVLNSSLFNPSVMEQQQQQHQQHQQQEYHPPPTTTTTMEPKQPMIVRPPLTAEEEEFHQAQVVRPYVQRQHHHHQSHPQHVPQTFATPSAALATQQMHQQHVQQNQQQNHAQITGPQTLPPPRTGHPDLNHDHKDISTELIQKYLDENQNLILAILENQNVGRLAECARYQNRLQQNLMYLASIADE